MITEYITYVDGEEVYKGDNLEDAIRAWDGNPKVFQGGVTPGGISIQQWIEDDLMVRDGWILHVYDNGQVYLNPNLRENDND